MAKRIMYWDDNKDQFTRGRRNGNQISMGRESLSNGTTSKTVTISPAMDDTTYAANVTMTNTVDSSPAVHPVIVTARSTTSFTVEWETSLGSANFELEWIVVG